MIGLLAALGACLAPANAIPLVANRALARARDRWLLTVLALGGVWLAVAGHYWLALMALHTLLAWPQTRPAELGGTGLAHEYLQTVVLWTSIGAAWLMLKQVPTWAWDWIADAWTLVAVAQVGILVLAQFTVPWPETNRPTLGHRAKGTFGSPVLTAIFLATMVPLVPVWLLPVLAVGLYLTFSYTSLLGVGVAVIASGSTIGGLAIVGVPLGLLWVTRRNPVDVQGKGTFGNQRLLEATPRGDSVDGWRGRWVESLLLLRTWWGAPWRMWLLGFGPDSAATHTRIWSSKQKQELPTGDAHCEPLQHLYEYGVVGAAAGVAFVTSLAPHLLIGDAWSAAWLALLAMSCVHWPVRHPALGALFLALSARLA